MTDKPFIGVEVLPAEPRQPTEVIVRYLDDGRRSKPITVITSGSQPAEWPPRTGPSSNVRPSRTKTTKQKTAELEKIEADIMAQAKAMMDAAYIENEAKLKAENDAFDARWRAEYAELHAISMQELRDREQKLDELKENLLDSSSGFVQASVAEIIGRIFAELPPDVVTIVRAAMDRVSGSVSTDGPVDLRGMMHGFGRPN